MNKKRFLRKALRPRMVLIYLLVVLIAVFILTYAFGGIKAEATSNDNVTFTFNSEEWQDMMEVTSYDNSKWVAQNDNYVLYFDEQSTIATLYVIENDAKTGSTVTHNGVSYPEIDITKCKVTYSTAQANNSSANSNIIVYCADSETGKMYDSYKSYANSVQFENKLTEATESHYFLNYIDGGVQVLYEIGSFNAGENYLPEYEIMTFYKPVEEIYYSKSTGEVDQEKYQEALNKWADYMRLLGVEDPLNAEYKEWLNALSVTLDERFRGNTTLYANKNSSGELEYTGSVDVYTKEAYEYFKELVDNGEVEAMAGKEITYSETPNSNDYNKNAFWNFKNISPDWLEGEGMKYFNTNSSPLTHNFFLSYKSYSTLKDSIYSVSQNTDKSDPNAIDFFDFPYYLRKSNLNGQPLVNAYSMLYKENEDIAGYKLKDGKLAGGYVKRNADGTFPQEGENIERALYTLETAAEDNARFNVESATALPIVQVGLQILLNEDGIKATIMQETLVDCKNAKDSDIVVAKQGSNEQTIADLNNKYILYKVDVFPYMAYVDNSKLTTGATAQKGRIIVPDGSGAIIEFDNGKTEMGATAVNQTYYGRDNAFVSQSVLEDTESLMLGMYGFIYDGNDEHIAHAILAAIEKGGNQVSLYAQTKDKKSSASFSGVLRLYEEVAIGAYTNKSKFNKWAPTLTNSDLEFQYIFLDASEANYSSMAKKYQEYLVKRDEITTTDTTNETVVDLNFLGSFEKYALFLGFKYKTPDTLTTFNQAGEIIDELSTGIEVDGQSRKVNAFSVSYTGWTNEELRYQVGGNITVSTKLGGKKGMQKFSDKLENMGISFYPEVYVTSTKGYDLAYGNLKYTARSISNAVANVYEFDVSTQRQNKKLPHTSMINPSYYSSITEDTVKKLNKIGVKNSYLVDLGNTTVGSYNKNSGVVYGQDAIVYQQKNLAKMAESGSVKVKAPYDYAFKYVDFATEIPLTSTKLAIYDETIPFYQLVVSGLFDYTTEEINGTSNYGANWYYAKAIESGANLSFQISATNPTVLLDTDYTYYYQSYYNNWKEIIVTLADKMDNLGIAKANLTSHQIIDKDISLVKYTLKDNSGVIEFYVNATSKDYTYTDSASNVIVIPAYGYITK